MKIKHLLKNLIVAIVFFMLAKQSYSTPSNCASNVTFSSITPTSFVVSWTKGNGDGRLVTIRPYGNAKKSPVSGSTNYTASSYYGNGSNLGSSNYVVYKSSGSSLTVYGLSAETRYTVEVFEYDYISILGIGYWYYCATSASGSHYTLATEPTTKPTNVSSTSITATSFTGTWTNGNGERRVGIVRPRYNSYYPPVDGVNYTPSTVYGYGSYLGSSNYVVYDNTGSSVAVTGLSPATEYYLIMYEYNYNSSSDQTYNYLTSSYGYDLFATVNNPPTLDNINDVTICQNSGPKTVNLTGIGSGGENQTLVVTAISDNTSLIPNPTVNYSSPNSTGSIYATPVSGAYGTAIISVKVNDQFVQTNTVIKTFKVTVLPLPSTPGSISGSSTVCQNQSGVSYSVGTISNADNYDWYLSPGTSIASGYGTKSITLDFSSSASSGYIWVRGHNSNCGYGSWSPAFYITVNQSPTAANAGSDITTCTGTGVLSANTPLLGTGLWSKVGGVGSIANTSDPNSIYAIASTGETATFIWTTSLNSCTSKDTVKIAYQNCPISADFYASNTEPCSGSATITIYNNCYGATSYNWNFGSGATPATSTFSVSSIEVTYSTSGAKDISVSVSGPGGSSNTTKSGYINVLSSPAAAGSVSGNTTICEGEIDINYSVGTISNATYYNWTLPNGAVLNTGTGTQAITVNYPEANSGAISVQGVNACGSGAPSPNYDIIVNSLPDDAGEISGSFTICQGTQFNYSIPAISDITYHWTVPPGASIVGSSNTNAIDVSFPYGSTSGNVEVYVDNACGTGLASDSLVIVNPLPDAASEVVGSSEPKACVLDKNVNYSTPLLNNASTYTWTLPQGASIVSGENTNSIEVDFSANASSGNILVAGTNACGNGTASSFSITYTPVTPITMCYVTVNDSSEYNEVAWLKPVSTLIDSFRIYREIGSNFAQIGSVEYTGHTSFTDSTATPNTTYHKYKVSAVDTCGNESSLSEFHQTILFQANKGASGEINMNWSEYIGGSFNFYYILRDTLGHANFEAIDSVSNSTTLYTVPISEVELYPNSSYAIGIDILNACSPSFKTEAASINTSRSNLKDKSSITLPGSIKGKVDLSSLVNVYPNPNSGIFNIEYPSLFKKTIIKMVDIQGNLVYTKTVLNEATYANDIRSTSVDVKNLAKGFYTLSIEGGEQKAYKKLIIE